MTTITVARVYKLKLRMEVKIQEAVHSFELDTGRNVRAIRLHRMHPEGPTGIVDIVESELFP